MTITRKQINEILVALNKNYEYSNNFVFGLDIYISLTPTKLYCTYNGVTLFERQINNYSQVTMLPNPYKDVFKFLFPLFIKFIEAEVK